MKKIYKIYIATGLVILSAFLFYTKDALYFAWKVNKLENRVGSHNPAIDEIVLVNIGDGDREYIANAVNTVSECSPRVIALDAFFLERKEKISDSLLMAAIRNSKVVLGIQGSPTGNFYRSDHYFDREASSTGLAQLFEDFGLAISFIPQRQMQDRNKTILNHISLAICSQYDSLKTKKFIDRTCNNQAYLILYSAMQSDFKSYEYNDLQFNCDQLQDKIIILGYLGPTEEDKFKTVLGLKGVPIKYNSQVGDMYGAVIIANQVLMILSESDLIPY